MTNDELLHKWVNGTLTTEEEHLFKQRPEYESLTQVYRMTEHLQVPNFDENAMLSEILKTKKESPIPHETTKIVSFSSYLKYGIAASVLIFATWFLFFNQKKQIVQIIATNQKIEDTLPDQSTFVLNLGSQLTYDKNNWFDDRQLDLEGEAFFNVKKGEKFIVKTKNGNVQVIGTQFNIWFRDAVLEVSCHSGKVVVLSSNNQVLTELNPTDAIRVLGNGDTEKWQISNTEKDNWTAGISRFKNVPLARVLEELERQFNIEIDENNVDTSVLISCNFQHKDLNLALKTVLLPLTIPYKTEGTKVKLFKG